MSETSPRRKIGCGYAAVATVGVLGVGAFYALNSLPDSTHHYEATVDFLGKERGLLSYNRNGPELELAFGKDTGLALNLVCTNDNVAEWSATASILGRDLTKGFDVNSNGETASPCVKEYFGHFGKTIVNPGYDKLATLHWVDFAEDVIREKFKDYVISKIPFPKLS